MSGVDNEAVKAYYSDQVKETPSKPSCCGPKKPATSCCAPPPSSNASGDAAADLVYQQDVRMLRNPCSTACDMGEGSLGSKVKAALKLVHPEIISQSFGCGSPFPPLLDGCKVLDLGSGTGRDCFVLSKLVGPEGHVTGVDMTPKMLEIATGHIAYHAEKIGHQNVEFKQGQLEHLVESTGLAENSFDVITSNCVVNLTSDKKRVFEDVFKLLKPGGEMYFSDVYAVQEVSEEARKHVVAWSECYSGALTLTEFDNMVHAVGFLGPFITKTTPYLPPDELKSVLEGFDFVSNTARLIKPAEPSLSTTNSCTLAFIGPHEDADFKLDNDFKFKIGETVTVPSEVRDAVSKSRYAKFFTSG